ncbi:hypothetical protein BD310DRAFT_937492 [Dichomitus squalens]|uniref:Uncharacterized protein n=1 Tax=Dichomitus squalens TaxID=114155 RepID=A0A4Q9PGP5_9APHY|nr:hypothetical protein BD310DRAFT_937492 [Dichomitus squalens]
MSPPTSTSNSRIHRCRFVLDQNRRHQHTQSLPVFVRRRNRCHQCAVIRRAGPRCLRRRPARMTRRILPCHLLLLVPRRITHSTSIGAYRYLRRERRASYNSFTTSRHLCTTSGTCETERPDAGASEDLHEQAGGTRLVAMLFEAKIPRFPLDTIWGPPRDEDLRGALYVPTDQSFSPEKTSFT